MASLLSWEVCCGRTTISLTTNIYLSFKLNCILMQMFKYKDKKDGVASYIRSVFLYILFTSAARFVRTFDKRHHFLCLRVKLISPQSPVS